jgi:hypothetical protein
MIQAIQIPCQNYKMVIAKILQKDHAEEILLIRHISRINHKKMKIVKSP